MCRVSRWAEANLAEQPLVLVDLDVRVSELYKCIDRDLWARDDTAVHDDDREDKGDDQHDRVTTIHRFLQESNRKIANFGKKVKLIEY